MRLEGVLGQGRALSQLEAEMANQRLAHAYLFVGPAGCGRGTTALALFKALNCQDQAAPRPCGACGPCRRVAAGHPYGGLIRRVAAGHPYEKPGN